MTTTLAHRRLIEAETMLTHITTHYGTTIRRLNDAQPGFPNRTPGSGEPGSGKGFTAGSTVERQAGKHNPETHDLNDALHLPATIATTASLYAIGAHLTIVNVPDGPRITLRKLCWTRWLLLQLIAQEHDGPGRQLILLHNKISTLHHITGRWGQPLHTPARQNLIPADLTGMWCTSCLRIGLKSPRHRGDRCSWCYTFEREERFTVPVELLEIRRDRKVFDRDVEPFRKAWREREKAKKQKRKKAG